MRVLLTAYAEKTHFLGMVPLAWALHNAGHEVRVASQPALTDVVTRAGLTAVPVGRDHMLGHILKRLDHFSPNGFGGAPDFDMAEDRAEYLTWEYLKGGYDYMVPFWWRIANDPMVGDLTAFCKQWQPDLVVWEAVTYAGPIAAAACGAAHVRFMWSLDLFGRMRGHYVRERDRRSEGERDDPLAEWLASRAARYGGTFDEDMTCGQATIDHLPTSLTLDTDLERIPLRYIPYNGSAVVPEWLRAEPERPRVCMTMGTSSTERLNGFAVSTGDILEALSELDVEVVATMPESERSALGRVPDNCRLVDFAPLNALAATSEVVINHGGPGTVLTALANAVPQVILPYPMFDAPALAEAMARSGGAVSIESSTATGAAVREGVELLLSDRARRGAASRLHEEMAAMPSPASVVTRLEEHVAARR